MNNSQQRRRILRKIDLDDLVGSVFEHNEKRADYLLVLSDGTIVVVEEVRGRPKPSDVINSIEGTLRKLNRALNCVEISTTLNKIICVIHFRKPHKMMPEVVLRYQRYFRAKYGVVLLEPIGCDVVLYQKLGIRTRF
ncbi:MAG: hypothetical protein DRJ40_07485 [Thermoprotei archaeon]|nr:MAG: hypothetical protein DRJ40_07485 [Thermoprotei archaeon]